MRLNITQKTIQEFVNDVSDQHYAMAGPVIAAAAAQAAALGEACMQISFDNQVDTLDWQDITSRIERLLHIKNTLLEWADQDAKTLAEHHNGASRDPLDQAMVEGPAEIAHLAITAMKMLQEFRPLAFTHLINGLDMSIYLLSGVAQAAICLLNSNLEQWPDSNFTAEYQSIATKLIAQMDQVAVPQ